MPRGSLLGTNEIAFGILEFDQPTDGGNFALRHDDLAAIGRDSCRGCINVVDRNCAFVARHALTGHDFMPFLQGPFYSGIVFVASRNQEKPGGPQG